MTRNGKDSEDYFTQRRNTAVTWLITYSWSYWLAREVMARQVSSQCLVASYLIFMRA